MSEVWEIRLASAAAHLRTMCIAVCVTDRLLLHSGIFVYNRFAIELERTVSGRGVQQLAALSEFRSRDRFRNF